MTKQLISREQFDRARMLNDLLDRKRLAAFAALHRVFRQTNYDERTNSGYPRVWGSWNPKLVHLIYMVGRCSVGTSWLYPATSCFFILTSCFQPNQIWLSMPSYQLHRTFSWKIARHPCLVKDQTIEVFQGFIWHQ